MIFTPEITAYGFDVKLNDNFHDKRRAVRGMCWMREVMSRKDETGRAARDEYKKVLLERPKVMKNTRTGLYYAIDKYLLRPNPPVGFAKINDAVNAWRLWTSYAKFILSAPEESVFHNFDSPDYTLYF